MKKTLLTLIVCLLTVALFVGCSDAQNETDAEPSAPETATPTDTPSTEEATEGNGSEIDINYYTGIYAAQLDRYHTAISAQWEEGAYLENEMSALAMYYYEGNALDNIGYTFIDLDNNGICELIIGAILNAEQDPIVFELWTIKDDAPTMLAQSGSRNRYFLQYDEEIELWSLANEGENGAANHAVYFLQISEGELNVTQGIVFDALANEENPWFMAYDLDWDVSNDTQTDEETANAVIEAGRRLYIAAEYIPYSQYK